MLKKIVILGPESTGKSTLCEQLAAHYNTKWCPEYAREYLLQHGMNYSYDDLLTIAKGQLGLEDKTVGSVQSAVGITPYSPVFIDTDMYVMKVWCEFVFGKCHRFILEKIVERSYDLYLLCDIDLPWTEDVLREYPTIEPRRQLFQMYHDIMINQSAPWVRVSGTYEERLQTAIAAVNKIL